MNKMHTLTINGTQYEIADKKAREEVAGKASKAYVDKTFAPAIPVTMTGTAVSTDMVSPVEHEVECRVSGVDDLAAVTVSRIGNNKLNLNNYSGDVSGIYTGWLVNPEGEIGRLLLFDKNNGADISGIFLGTTKTGINPSSGYTWAIANGVLEKTEISSNYKYVSIHPKGEASIKKLLARFDVMYTLGDSNVYEPYKGQDYHPSPDGTVSGMMSIASGMTITTNQPNMTVEVTYNADTKKYIDQKLIRLQAMALENGGM